jgi:hypothetical protein
MIKIVDLYYALRPLFENKKNKKCKFSVNVEINKFNHKFWGNMKKKSVAFATKEQLSFHSV